MKNSPDPEWFHKLEKRLGDYSEEPDADVRDKIVGMLGKPRDPVWMPWAHRSAVLVYIFIVLWSGIDWINPVVELNERPAMDIHAPLAEEGSSRHAQKSYPNAWLQSEPSGTDRRSETPAKIYETGVHTESISDNTEEHAVELSQTPQTADPVFFSLESDSGAMARKEMIETDSVNSETPELDLLSLSDQKGVIIPGRRKRKLILYGNFSPSLSFQKISPIANDGVVIDALYVRPVFSEDRLGVSFQAGVQSKISRSLEVYGGLSLYHQTQDLIYHYVSGSEVNVSPDKDFDYSVTPGTTEVRARYAMLNVGTQAGLVYYLSGDQLSHKIGAGISWYHGTRKKSAGEMYHNAKSQYLFYEVFYRNEYVVNSSVNIFIQPFYKHCLISRETFDAPFHAKPYEAGLSVGMLYHFR